MDGPRYVRRPLTPRWGELGGLGVLGARYPLPAGERGSTDLTSSRLARRADEQKRIEERVLEPDGRLHVRTVNRFSLLPEPHVGVWGVGFVPRRWADAYVRWRSGQRYEHHRPLSPREIRRAARASGLRDIRVAAATLLSADRARLGALAAVAPAYELARRTPAIGRLVSWAAPLLDLEARRAPESGAR